MARLPRHSVTAGNAVSWLAAALNTCWRALGELCVMRYRKQRVCVAHALSTGCFGTVMYTAAQCHGRVTSIVVILKHCHLLGACCGVPHQLHQATTHTHTIIHSVHENHSCSSDRILIGPTPYDPSASQQVVQAAAPPSIEQPNQD